MAILCTKNPGFSFCNSNSVRSLASSAIRRSPAIRNSHDPFSETETKSVNADPSPFEDIVTRAPPSSTPRKGHKVVSGPMYNIYPILYPKNEDYCPQMSRIFAWTCQPSKPLRGDLVEFCKEYSIFCNVPNTHRLRGPGTGPRPDAGHGQGHIDISSNFGFSIGSVPGLEVNAGWGVDVGPIPGVGDSVDVGINGGVGLLGAKSPLAFRRGMDNPDQKGSGGIVGITGGVGVNPGGGVGPIGVASGIGV
uniref:Fork-head domain-containing protein n=1 Tax=Rhabditophanes sp. KR3021 TaxID=114890 RepID=A0AC35U7F7_9BILA